MKKLLLMAIIAATVSAPALAQEQKDVKQDKTAWEKKFKEDLKLTAEQSVKYDALSKEYGAKIDALAGDASLNDESRKEKKMALKKEKEAKLMEFLTPEQQTKYKAIMEEKKKNMKPAS